MPKHLLLVVCLLLAGLAPLAAAEPATVKINKIATNGGYIQSAKLFYENNRMYVRGVVKPYSWDRTVSVRVDLKDAQGNVIASGTDTTEATGRPQLYKMFGVSYRVAFDKVQTNGMAAIDVQVD